MEGAGEPPGVINYGFLYFFADRRGGVDGDAVSRVDARPLDVLHYAGDEDVRPVADRVDLDLLPLKVLVYQDRVVLRDSVYDADELLYLVIVKGDAHPLPAEHIRGAHQDGVAEAVRDLLRLLCGVDRAARRAGDFRLLQDAVEQLPVLRRVNVLRLCPKDFYAHLHKALGELYRGLPAELHHRAVGLFEPHYGLDVLGGERLEVELVGDVEVGRYRLGVVVYDDGLPPLPRERPGAVHGAVVELYALPDSDGAGA